MARTELNIEEYIRENGMELFRSVEGEAYLRKENETYSVNSQNVCDMFALAHKENFGRLPILSQEKKYIRHLNLLARNQGREYYFHLRVAKEENCFWYDLGSAAIRVSSEGWSEVERSTVLFKRYGNFDMQVRPGIDEAVKLAEGSKGTFI